jgi:sarcosine oxidase
MSMPRSNIQSCRVLIIGACGLVGSSAFYHAAKLEAESPSATPTTPLFTAPSVIAIDQYDPGHAHGSSHGESRITRLSSGEGEEYAALAKRSHEIWRDVESRVNYAYGNLLNITPAGGLIIARRDLPASYHGAENFVMNSAMVAHQSNLSFAVLDGEELFQPYPQFKFPAHSAALMERSMGYINPDACIKSNLQLATRNHHGQLRLNEKVLRFEQMDNNKIKVTTTKNGVEYQYFTNKLIIAAGPWINNLIKEEELKVYRQVVYWFKVESTALNKYARDIFPTFIWSLDNAKMVYGFPLMKDQTAIKIGTESYEILTTPETVDRQVSPQEINDFYDKVIRPNFNGITRECVKAEVCLYTVAPKWKFVVDFLPGFEDNVIVASACSGHGAKHAAAIGQAVAQQSLFGESDIPVIKLFGGVLTQKEPPVPLHSPSQRRSFV